MMNPRFIPGILVLCLAGKMFAASLADIHTAKLPQDASIGPVVAEVQDLEPYVQSFSPTWNAPVKKEEAIAKLDLAMKTLEAARKKYPQNEELALLSGLVASYAFNLDVKDSWNVAPSALTAASQLDPSDFRGKWFLAAHNCQTATLLPSGMKALLEIDASASTDLPASFWLDEMACATETEMPAHALRAESHLSTDARSNRLVEAILSKYKGIASVDTNYKPEDLWFFDPTDNGTTYRNYACGLSFTIPAAWTPSFYPIADGKCAMTLAMAPIKGVKGEWTPEVAVIAHVERPRDSFAEYAEHLEGSGGAAQQNSSLSTLCPVAKCRAADLFDQKLYPGEGGGHGYLLQFERSRPEWSGIALETQPISLASVPDKITTFRTPDYVARFPGNIYYSFLLDSATSILPEAQKEFQIFMKTVRVD